jgi:4a-hydroxytetrahydrobiopterin dehydratase
MSETWDDAAIDAALAPGWSRDAAGALLFTWRAPSVAQAFGFLTAVALLAERADHHPEATWIHHTITLRLLTHDAANAVTARDVALMKAIAALPRD